LSAPARSSEHLRWLPAKSNRCAKVAKSRRRNSCGRKISDTNIQFKMTKTVCKLYEYN